jgi:K(+)-stimulated pyrophosphate-energized sodium pump
MLDVSAIIWETCKSYLAQQGKFLLGLWVLIAICMIYYFMGLSHAPFGNMVIILVCSILGILGSYGVAWFGMRINTWANSRTAFASLRGKPVDVVTIPLTSGMSVGLLLSVELFFMMCCLVFLPTELVGPSFFVFSIGG